MLKKLKRAIGITHIEDRMEHLEKRFEALQDDYIKVVHQIAGKHKWQDHNVAVLANVVDRKINKRKQTKRVRVKKSVIKKK